MKLVLTVALVSVIILNTMGELIGGFKSDLDLKNRRAFFTKKSLPFRSEEVLHSELSDCILEKCFLLGEECTRGHDVDMRLSEALCVAGFRLCATSCLTRRGPQRSV
ncbi:hypothetical protein HHUSO_G13924 [Huso huso]|uniref:Uncharacterized protein n=1 Tax=Huso huso TaxID=61971 RepID=A0ABR0ZHC3_HUSHU